MSDSGTSSGVTMDVLQLLSTELLMALFFKNIFGFKPSDLYIHDTFMTDIFQVMIESIRDELQRQSLQYDNMVFHKWYPDIVQVTNVILTQNDIQTSKRMTESLQRLLLIGDLIMDRFEKDVDTQSSHATSDTKKGGDFEFVFSEDDRVHSPKSMSMHKKTK